MGEIFRLNNKIQNYAWGSHSTLADMRNLPVPSKQPEAEVWVGAHPSAPSEVEIDGATVALDDLVKRSPNRILPSGTSDFPFLFKILAIDAPLSIQVHPTDAQAQAGFAREEAAGIQLDDPSRNYKDQHSKPETVIALSPMRILTGVRPPTELDTIAEAFELSWLSAITSAKSAKDILVSIITMDEDDAHRAAQATIVGARRWGASSESVSLLDHLVELIETICEKCCDDTGLLIAVAMNLLNLEPGDAAFIPDGQVHAYISGTAIEIMNPSDNVLRAGLTPKHIDATELMKILREDQRAPQIQRAEPDHAEVGVFSLWDERMSVTRVRLSEGEEVKLDVHGTATALGTRGELTFISADQTLTINPIESFLHIGSDTSLIVRGAGEAFIASYV